MTETTDRVVLEKIVQALASYLKRDPASITESHHLRDDLGLDSVAVIELLFEIEERFKLQIPDQDLPGLSTVGSVAAYVQQRLAEPKTEVADGPTVAPKSKSSKSPSKSSSKSSSSKASSSKSATPKKPSAKSAPTKKTKPTAGVAAKKKKKVGAR